MKWIAIIAAFLTPCVWADTSVRREQIEGLKSFDANKIKASLPLLEGKIVKIKFTFRSASLQKLTDGNFAAKVKDSESTFLPVIIPADAVEWFNKISTHSDARKTNVVYATVSGSAVTLIGREVVRDHDGIRIVWNPATTQKTSRR